MPTSAREYDWDDVGIAPYIGSSPVCISHTGDRLFDPFSVQYSFCQFVALVAELEQEEGRILPQ